MRQQRHGFGCISPLQHGFAASLINIGNSQLHLCRRCSPGAFARRAASFFSASEELRSFIVHSSPPQCRAFGNINTASRASLSVSCAAQQIARADADQQCTFTQHSPRRGTPQALCLEDLGMKPTEKLDIACELLDRGLRLYYAKDSYFASIHLAGGAEEILGRYVESVGAEPAFTNLRTAAVRISGLISEDGVESTEKSIGDLMNHAKNNTKHGSGIVSFDPEKEAKELFDRAVTNYYFLMNHFPLLETELIRRFNEDSVNA